MSADVETGALVAGDVVPQFTAATEPEESKKSVRPHHPCYHSMSTITQHDFCQQLKSRVRPGPEHEGLAHTIVETVEGDAWQAVVLVLIVTDVCAVVLELLIDSKTLVFDDENTKASTMHILHAVSIGILVVFAVELLMLLCALGFRHFFQHKWFTLDLLVVYGALVLEVFKPGGAGSLIVLTRAWRLVRVVHGFIELEKHQHDKVSELKKTQANLHKLHQEHELMMEQHRHMSFRLSEKDPQWLDTHYPEEHMDIHKVARDPPPHLPKTSVLSEEFPETRRSLGHTAS